MGRQRFIHPELWSDPTLARLAPIERLFFIGCFSSADDEGRLLGNPAYLRSTIFPYDDLSIEEVTRIRDQVTSICKNLILYVVDEEEYLAFRKWSQFQKPKYPKESKLPVPPSYSPKPKQGNPEQEIGETFPQNKGKHGETLEEDVHHGLGRDGLGLDRVGMGRDGASEKNSDVKLPQPDPLPEHTETERALLHELKSVLDYPFDFPKDLEYIRNLSVEFPNLDLLAESKKWRTYKLDKPLLKKSNARLQFRNWCEIAVKKGEVNPNGNTEGSHGATGPPRQQSKYPMPRYINGEEHYY